jgi:hypothetical protein
MEKIFNVLSKTNYFDSYFYDFLSPLNEYLNQTEAKFYNLHIGESNKTQVMTYSYCTTTTNKPKATFHEETDSTTTILKKLNSYSNLNKSGVSRQNSIAGMVINIKKFEKVELMNRYNSKNDRSENILLL